MIPSISIISLLTILAGGYAELAPTPTPPPIIARTVYTPTEYWDYATTSIPMDDHFIGVIKVSDRDELWSLSCINAPLTVSAGYAGCGLDDLYTRCLGSTAYGADGDNIRCKSGYRCISHSIYEDFTAYNASSYTPFLGCGLSTATMDIIRTPSLTSTQSLSSPLPTETTARETTSTRSVGSRDIFVGAPEQKCAVDHAGQAAFPSREGTLVAPLYGLAKSFNRSFYTISGGPLIMTPAALMSCKSSPLQPAVLEMSAFSSWTQLRRLCMRDASTAAGCLQPLVQC
ncbi:hypothetical protein CC78DRAFT_619001 [Lojkania enalia]|uniref:Uncharacterized protein n=1 Tax=Lojkania enalia TaxID=147567 RepID=A0A9P4K4C6_9PLEO|nr:hypothetical protein CC78DRAFT_619001 [Didymosphaeria enalia]